LSGLEGPSASALFQPSFPQPSQFDVDADAHAHVNGQGNDSEDDHNTTASAATPSALGLLRSSDREDDMLTGTDGDNFVDALSELEDDDDDHDGPSAAPKTPRRPSAKSFVTASSTQITPGQDESGQDSDNVPLKQDEHDEHHQGQQEQQKQKQSQVQTIGLHMPAQSETGSASATQQPLPARQSLGAPASTVGPPSVDVESTSSLLPQADVNKAPASAHVDSNPPAKGILARVKRRSTMALSNSETSNPADDPTPHLAQRKSNLRNLVKFDIPEDSRRATVHLKAKKAQMTIQRAGVKLRRKSIKDGLVVKMERMLVRVDATAGKVPDDFDENANQKVVSNIKDKWREYMVVCRHSHVDNAEFLLQLYRTRVCRTPVPFTMIQNSHRAR
jgi:hypothetical protein